MPVKSLKGLRRKQAHDTLVQQGYTVINHHYNRVDCETLLQLALRRLAKLQDKSEAYIFHLLASELSHFKRATRVNKLTENPEMLDERVVCLLYGNPEQNVHNVQESCTQYNTEDLDNNTNVVADQTNKPEAPNSISTDSE